MVWEIYRRPMEHHLPYGITQCYLPHGWVCPALTSVKTYKPWRDKRLSWNLRLAAFIPRWFAYPQTVTHRSSHHWIATWW